MGLGSGIRKKSIPDPGVKKAPDPGSATLPTAQRNRHLTALTNTGFISPAHFIQFIPIEIK